LIAAKPELAARVIARFLDASHHRRQAARSV
jgi:hypothetical protein